MLLFQREGKSIGIVSVGQDRHGKTITGNLRHYFAKKFSDLKMKENLVNWELPKNAKYRFFSKHLCSGSNVEAHRRFQINGKLYNVSSIEKYDVK